MKTCVAITAALLVLGGILAFTFYNNANLHFWKEPSKIKCTQLFDKEINQNLEFTDKKRDFSFGE